MPSTSLSSRVAVKGALRSFHRPQPVHTFPLNRGCFLGPAEGVWAGEGLIPRPWHFKKSHPRILTW